MRTVTRPRQTFDPIPEHAARFTSLLRSLTADERNATVPGLTWTAADVGAHVLTVLERYGTNTRRAATRAELAAQNEQELRGQHLDLGDVADRIDAAIALLARSAPDLPLDLQVPFHMGLTVDLAAAWANLASEFLVHSHDVAQATGRTWSFPQSDVEGIWLDLVPVLGGWLRPEARRVDELYELRFPFGAAQLWLRDGRVTVDDTARDPDHVIEIVDAVEFTLAVPWRRTLVTDPWAALLLSRLHEI